MGCRCVSIDTFFVELKLDTSIYLEHLKICSNVLQNIQFMKPSRFHVVPAVKYNKYSYMNNIYMWKLLRLSQLKLFVRRLHRNINRGKSEMGINSKNFIDTRSVRLSNSFLRQLIQCDTNWIQSDTLYDKVIHYTTSLIHFTTNLIQFTTIYDKPDTIYDKSDTSETSETKWYKWDKLDANLIQFTTNLGMFATTGCILDKLLHSC